MTNLARFAVQESVHADHVARHASRDEAIAAIETMIAAGLAEPGRAEHPRDRRDGQTIRVFGVGDEPISVR